MANHGEGSESLENALVALELEARRYNEVIERAQQEQRDAASQDNK